MKHPKEKSRRHLFSVFVVCLLVTTVGWQFIGYAEANFMPIPIPQPAFVIKSDGSIDPPSAPIHRDGNVYTFTGNIVGYTVAVERDNIMLDGNGYVLQGNGSSTGLFLKNRNGVTVRNMNISGFTYGIRLFAEDLFGMNSTGNDLSNNLLASNDYGIYISYSSDNLLRNNRMKNNTYNFWIKGGYISEREAGYVNDIDASNTVGDKPIIYWANVQNKVAPSDAGFVAFVNCTNVTAQGLSLSDNGQGVLVVSTVNVTVTQNAISECTSGVYLFNSTNVAVAENNLANNDEGIRGESSSNSQMSSNNVTSNKSGIYFTGISANNTIARNNITSNTVDGLNLWGSTNTSLTENTIAFNNETGINLFDSRKNNITENTITNNTGIGIKLWYNADENVFSKNNITSNNIGILIEDSFDNTIVGNRIKDNTDWGMRFQGNQNNNFVLQNSFINNRPASDGLQVSVTGVGFLDPKPGGGNVWDNGVAGNYWSDYQTRYHNATELGSSGIGNTPFFINQDNIDRYPLMRHLETSVAISSPEPMTSSLSPSPSIPEFPIMVVPALLAVASFFLLILKLNRKMGCR
jgi:parallel beta-helix repeat protein